MAIDIIHPNSDKPTLGPAAAKVSHTLEQQMAVDTIYTPTLARKWGSKVYSK